MRGSWLTGSDRTVQSESENYGCKEEREGSLVSIFPPADFKILRMLASWMDFCSKGKTWLALF